MKLTFSTLACPDWTWTEVQATAVELGYKGVELHGLKHETFLPAAAPFIPERLSQTKEQLDKIGLQISAFSTGALLHSKETEQRQAYSEEVKAYIKLAAELGVDYVHVRGDHRAEPGGEVCDQLVLDALMELG
ncbi:MAG: TIM barrel protein, partial [Firmicutes bacterium]|nr:TIM barrel protein [Bacillota bacterium]